MELEYTTADGRLTVKIEGKTQIDLWEQLASFQEVFENENVTAEINGKSFKSDDIKYRVRNVKFKDEKGKEKECSYYEKVCMSGPLKYYKKVFGVLSEGGGLFPKNPKDMENVTLGDNGWFKANFTPKEDS